MRSVRPARYGVAAAITFAPALALAAGGEHHATFDVGSFVLQLVNLGLLLFVLIKFGGKAVNKGLAARHEQLKLELESAQREKNEAEARLREHERRLAQIEAEVGRIRATVKQEANDEKARLIAAAEERAGRIKTETAFLLDQQVKQAQATLRAEVAEAAFKVAEQLIKRAVDSGDQKRMIDSFVAEVDAGSRSSVGGGPS